MSHQIQEASPPRSGLCRIYLWPAETGPQSTKSPIRSLIRFLVPRITLRTFNTTLFTTPDNYNAHISNSRYSPDESHNTLYANNIIRPLSPSARDKLTTRGTPCILARMVTMATARTPLLLGMTDNSLRAIAHVGPIHLLLATTD